MFRKYFGFMGFILPILVSPAYAQYSACGGTTDHPCDCSERYESDANGIWSCQADQHCADTNCGDPSARSNAFKKPISNNKLNMIKEFRSIPTPKVESKIDGKNLNYGKQPPQKCVSYWPAGGMVGITNSCDDCVVAKYFWQGTGINYYQLAPYQSSTIEALSSYGTPAGEQPCSGQQKTDKRKHKRKQ